MNRETGPLGSKAGQSLGEDPTSFPQPVTNPEVSTHLIGHTVEKALDATLWRLVLGEIELTDCTPALCAWYHIGFFDGIASQAKTIRQLKHDADRYYAIAFNDPLLAKKVTERMEAEFIKTIQEDMDRNSATYRAMGGER